MRFLLAALIAVLTLATLPVLLPERAQAQDQGDTELEVTEVTPSAVRGDSPPEVTVTGRLTNTSDTAINDVEARIQRGNPTTTEPETERAMREGAEPVTEPQFNPVVDRIEPGEQITVEFSAPTGPDGLQIEEPGTYPLLVNVNGSSAGGGRARVAEEQFLLPVLAPPGGQPQTPPEPTSVSMTVPIVDFPRLERQTLPGSQAVLVDDELSASLAPGGRLYELVQSVADRAPPGSPLGSSLCFAIDPDLLVTVEAMTSQYQVRQPDGSTREGIGSSAAQLWLSKLRDATEGRCVTALPYGDADIVALGRAGLPDLIDGAMDGTDLVRRILRTEPRKTLWPIEGALDEPAAGELDQVDTALLAPSALSTPPGSLSPAKVSGHDLTAVPVDPLLRTALDPNSGTPDEVTDLSPPSNGMLTAQNALGALAFRATAGALPDSTSVLVPPRRWNMRGDDVRALLDGMQQLTDAGYIRPTSLPDPPPEGLPEAGLNYPAQAADAEIPRSVLGELAGQNFKVGDLYRSSETDPSNDIDRGRITTPLRNGLLRGASSAWRGDPDAAHRSVGVGTRAVNNVLNKVHLDGYHGKITLAQANSPVPVTVVNDLPVTVKVVLHIPRVPGVDIENFDGTLTIPANGKRQLHVNTTAHRAGKFNIDFAAATRSGTQLGEPLRLEVTSNAAGPLIPVLTGVAGGLLVLLSGYRIFRRTQRSRAQRQEQNSAGSPPGRPPHGEPGGQPDATDGTPGSTGRSDRSSD